MSTELERYKEAVRIALSALNAASRHMNSTFAGAALTDIRTIEALVNPPPEYEEVEVVRWMCAGCEEVYDFKPVTTNCGAELDRRGNECECTEYIKLTGTLRRPSPQKVERSGKLSLYGDGSYCLEIDGSKMQTRVDIDGDFRWVEVGK